MTSAAEQWAFDLARWGIPEEILAQAPVSPWIHPPVLFDVPAVIETNPSHEAARTALGEGGSLLDVGCGGGMATLAVAPAIKYATGVDTHDEMLAMYQRNTAARQVVANTVRGEWPSAAPMCGVHDVVVCHHVAYNVSDITPFVRALTASARRRVVVELPLVHPLATLSPAWAAFWGLDRPQGPVASDFVAVVSDTGVVPHVTEFRAPLRNESDDDLAVVHMRTRLCLRPDRDDDVREWLRTHPAPTERALVTVWWDVE